MADIPLWLLLVILFVMGALFAVVIYSMSRAAISDELDARGVGKAKGK